MNSTLTKIAIFIAGSIIGSTTTYKLIKNKYEKIAQEEIESVKEVFARREAKRNAELMDIYNASADKESFSDSDKEEYSSKVRELRYDGNEEEKNMSNTPYIIPPEEFGMLDDYKEASLTYYEGDGVLADDFDNPVDDVKELVGEDFADHFGEYEDDSVFVRNDRTKTDYEILLDVRRYSDIK